jgi:hypothetical protein
MNPACSSDSTLTDATKPSISASESTPPQVKNTLDERPFPFLKLSAELRNEIYSLVLGGSKAIHMRRFEDQSELEERKRWSAKVCIAPPSRHEPFWNLTGMAHLRYDAAGSDRHMVWDWGPKWAPCNGKGGCCPPWNDAATPLQVQLLRVCRQIHSEATLVPFKENLFDSFGRFAPGWPFLTCAFDTLQCHAIANVAVLCCLINVRRLPALLPGLKRLFCEVDSHCCCDCELDDIFSNANERTKEEAAENDRARWEAIRAQVEEMCRIVRGMGCLAVKVKLEMSTWHQRFHTHEDVMTFERRLWMIAELEEAFVAEKSVGEDESVGNGDGAVRDHQEKRTSTS